MASEQQNQAPREDGKTLLREDQLMDISQLPDLPTEDKSRLDVPSLISQAKAGLGNLASMITKPNQIKEEDKVFKREDELADVSQIDVSTLLDDRTAIDKLGEIGKSLIDQAKGRLSNLTSKLSGPRENEGEQGASQQKEETQDQAPENKQSFVDIVKGKVAEIKERFTNKEEKEEDEGFNTVTNGFSETVEELRHEQGEDLVAKQLHSNNPFEALDDNIQEEQVENEGKSLNSKIQGGFNDAASKVKSMFVPQDKENAPQVA